MNAPQRAICRELLRLNYEYGFGDSFYLPDIAKRLGIGADIVLYDGDTETGLLFDLGSHGEALLEFSDDGRYASVNFETRDMVEAWSREP